MSAVNFYDNDVIEIAKGIELSARGELEVSTVNERYLEGGSCRCAFSTVVWRGSTRERLSR